MFLESSEMGFIHDLNLASGVRCARGNWYDMMNRKMISQCPYRVLLKKGLRVNEGKMKGGL